MQTAADCIPCFVRQAAEAVMLCDETQVPREIILRRILHELADADWSGSPPEVAQLQHRIIREDIECFRHADLIIAKGQGNYETLSQAAAPIFFLFTVKCPLVAAHIGSPTGTLIAQRTAAWGG